MKHLSKIQYEFIKTAGKWGYGPFDSDEAKDYAWKLEIKLLKEALKLKEKEEAAVILELLTHIKNNSLDKAKILYKQLRETLLLNIDEWANNNHSKPEQAKKEFLKLIKNLDKRIFAGEFLIATEYKN